MVGGFWWHFLAYKSYTSVEETELSLQNPSDAIPVLHRGLRTAQCGAGSRANEVRMTGSGDDLMTLQGSMTERKNWGFVLRIKIPA